MMLPAAAARFWVRGLEGMCLLAVLFGAVSSYFGLLISYHLSVASGPGDHPDRRGDLCRLAGVRPPRGRDDPGTLDPSSYRIKDYFHVVFQSSAA